jgi:hypothetical protein
MGNGRVAWGTLEARNDVCGRILTYADVCIYTAGLLGAHWKHETTVSDDFGSFTGAHALYWYKRSC